MDELAYHPYPDRDRDPLMKGYRWPNAGVPNLGRIKQAFWDAFGGTAQPLFPEGTLERSEVPARRARLAGQCRSFGRVRLLRPGEYPADERKRAGAHLR